MKKVIGIVSEGPTDFMVLRAVIDRITGEENRYLPLQPEPDMLGRYGNGWKGVWRWCNAVNSITLLMKEVQPNIDAIVIQMDGDVIRKEKEAHCLCNTTVCEEKGKCFPLYCGKVGEDCPVVIPCKSHVNGIKGRMDHGVSILTAALGNEDMTHIAITVPCDSTDTWVVAAYDDIDNIETFEEPWKNIIAKGKYYHGIRVRGDKKNAVTYSGFADRVVEQWGAVKEKCRSAMILEEEIKRILL